MIPGVQILAALAVLVATLQVSSSERIVNGSAVQGAALYPFMASLRSGPKLDDHFCGGTLIANTYVLTAAHCVSDLSTTPENVLVVLGQTALSSASGTRRTARSIVVYPAYDPRRLNNDLALIQIDSVDIAPVVLGDSEDERSTVNATVMGWGTLLAGVPAFPDQLQFAEVPLVSGSRCRAVYGNESFFPSSMLCAGKLSTSSSSGDGVDACEGDSGGPLLNETGRQIGVVSSGIGCAGPRFPGIYTRLAVFRDWIQSRPPPAPILVQNPRVSGLPDTGSILLCGEDVWAGGQIEQKSYAWWRRSARARRPARAVQVGEGTAYLVKLADAGGFLSCSVKAGNMGSEVSAKSQEVGPVTNSTGVTDRSPPASALLGAKCGRSVCVLHVSVQDSEPSSGVKSVRLTVNGRTYPARPDGHSPVWTASLPRGSGSKLSVSITAADRAGNEERVVKRVNAKMRRYHGARRGGARGPD